MQYWSLKSLALLLVILLSSQIGFAGTGWTNSKGSGFFKLSQNAIFGNRYFTKNGDVIDLNPAINLYTSSLYAEYAFTDNFTGVLYSPFFVRSTINQLKDSNGNTVDDGDEMNAVGDFDVAFRLGLIQDRPTVLAVSLTLGLPFGETRGGEGMILQSGDGEFNQMIRVEAGRSFHPLPFYASAFVGFNNRTKNFSDEVHAGLELGYSKDRLTASLKFHNVTSLYNGDANNTGNGIFSNNTEYLSFSPEVMYSLGKHFGVSVSGGFAFFGKQILAAPNWSGGLFYKL